MSKLLKVLFVDDDAFLMDMYSVKFTNAGHTFVPAKNVKEALDKLRAGLIVDGIVTDLVMPGMDGFQMIDIIKKENLAGNAKIIVLTNQSENADIERAKSLGAVGHVVKANAIPSEVLSIVEKLVS